MNDINAIRNRTILRIMAVAVGFIGLIYIAYLVRAQLAWVGIAFFLAIGLNPAVQRFSKHMPKKSRGLAAGLLFLLIIGAIAVMAVTMIPPLIDQTQQLIKNFPTITNDIIEANNPFSEFLRQYEIAPQLKANQERIAETISGLGGSALDFIKAIFHSIVATLTILVLTFFMLIEGPRWIKVIRQHGSQTQLAHREKLAMQMYEAVTGYVNGNLFTSLIAAVVTSIFLTLIGVPYSIPLGIVVGIFDLMPLVGATIGAAIVVLVSLFSGLPAALAATIFFVIYQQFENHVLQPLVYAKTVEMSPMTVLIAALLGTALGGLVGAIVAIPIVASLLILLKDYLQNHRAKV